MADGPHRTQIDDNIEDAMQRLLDSTQNLQRRIFRISRRGFITPSAVGQMAYDAESVTRDVGDLKQALGEGN